MTVPNLTQEGEANSLRRSREPYVKELGKLTPYLWKKGYLSLGNQREVALTRGWRLFTKNTGLCEVARRRIGTDACPVPEG